MNKISTRVVAQLRELSCECVAEKLGMAVFKHKALCFMHDDHNPSVSFYGRNREKWFCFVCSQGGSPIDLVIQYTGCNFIEACNWLCEQFSISSDLYEPVKLKFKARQIAKKDETMGEGKLFNKEVAQWILDNNSLTAEGEAFLFAERRLSSDVVKKLKIVSIDNSNSLVQKLSQVFSSETLEKSGFVKMTNKKLYLRIFTPCLIFPYYDQQGELVGVQSRYLGENQESPRFQFVSSQKSRLFNLPILEGMEDGEDLYISEGITDCLALLSAGKKAVALPSATILPYCDLADLKSYCLHMFPDGDSAGRRAYEELKRYFINLSAVIQEEKLPAHLKDFSEYYLAQLGGAEGLLPLEEPPCDVSCSVDGDVVEVSTEKIGGEEFGGEPDDSLSSVEDNPTTMAPTQLEVCVDSLQSALMAQEAGAYRVEFCDNLVEGGTTPSYGQIKLARELLQLKLYVIIRPRGGNFLYSELEFEVMKEDIRQCGNLQCDGVVIGMLTADGSIDEVRTKELVSLAKSYGMEVKFYRAFLGTVNLD
ncbi:MAG: copper homeostasis protein CutC [Phocaeicola sp.]